MMFWNLSLYRGLNPYQVQAHVPVAGCQALWTRMFQLASPVYQQRHDAIQVSSLCEMLQLL